MEFEECLTDIGTSGIFVEPEESEDDQDSDFYQSIEGISI